MHTSTLTSIATFTPVSPLSGQESTMNSIIDERSIGLLGQRPSVDAEPREPDSPPEPVSPPGVDRPIPQRAPVARCADGHGTMTGLFFSDNIIDIARAKAMCALCPLRESCLADAIEREEPWGVWGGELLSGGRIIANKRACGRPPTRPRPEMIIDELGPVGVVA